MSPSPIPLGTVGFLLNLVSSTTSPLGSKETAFCTSSQYQCPVFKVCLVLENQQVPVLAHCGQRGMRHPTFTNIFRHGLPLLNNYRGWAVLVLPTHILYVFPLTYRRQATSIYFYVVQTMVHRECSDELLGMSRVG
jgi:hypothetical protein